MTNLSAAAVVAVLGGMFVVGAQAQSIPSNASAESNNKPVAWAANTAVTLYIDVSTIPQGSPLYNSILTGLNNTSSAFSSTYNVTYSSPVLVYGCPVTSGPSQIFYGASQPQGYPASNSQTFDTTTNNLTYQPLITSEVTLDTSQMNKIDGTFSPDYGIHVSAHEILHDYSIGDCPDCSPDYSLSSYQGTPDSPGLYNPSSYDVNQSAYYYVFGAE